MKPKKIIRELIIACVCLAGAFAHAQEPVTVHPNQKILLESDNPKLAVNKKLVYDFWRTLIIARQIKETDKYMAENYIQHNPTIPTGRAPFVAFFGRSEPGPLPDEIPGLVNIIAEGDTVILAFLRELPDPNNEGGNYTTTWFDMFRIENGLVAEHWDYGTKR